MTTGLGGASARGSTEPRWQFGEKLVSVGSGAISLISGGSMKHVVVDVAEEGGIHQIRGRYGEIQRFSSRKRAFHRIATEAPPRLGGASGRGTLSPRRHRASDRRLGSDQGRTEPRGLVVYSPRATPSSECFASSCSQSWRKRRAVSCNGGSPGGMSGRASRPPVPRPPRGLSIVATGLHAGRQAPLYHSNA